MIINFQKNVEPLFPPPALIPLVPAGWAGGPAGTTTTSVRRSPVSEDTCVRNESVSSLVGLRGTRSDDCGTGLPLRLPAGILVP